MIKQTFFKYEPYLLLISLALVLTFVPMLISAASTPLVALGIGYTITLALWFWNFLFRAL